MKKMLFPTIVISAMCLTMVIMVAPGCSAQQVEMLGSDVGHFLISSQHGNLVLGVGGGQRLLTDCRDIYILATKQGQVRSTEAADKVASVCREGQAVVMECYNEDLGLRVSKRYELVADGYGLAKTVTVGPLQEWGELAVRSVVNLVPSFREDAFYYSPRQSWVTSYLTPELDLTGVQPASKFTRPVVSGAGWDNRLVVAFPREGMAVGHYRYAVNDVHVMPSSVLGSWAQVHENALTYTPTGWDFEILHALEGEGQPVSATVHYMLCSGDFLDVWQRYRQLPEQQAWENRPVPAWCQKVKLHSDWNPTFDPERDAPRIAAAHQIAEMLGDKYLTISVFAWSLDGDYETEGAFVDKYGNGPLTADYLKNQLAAFQKDERVRTGLYFQGCLIERLSKAYQKHPEWALQTAEGNPFWSGFRDNKREGGAQDFFNPLDPAWVRHYMSRIKAVCHTYQLGWIYCDGGIYLETTDYRMRRAVLPDTWDRFFREQWEVAHQSDPERAVLLNAPNFPYGDMYWLECGEFKPDAPWWHLVNFCFDTEILHRPERTMIPLPWYEYDEKRYLAMCVAFGFTPSLPRRIWPSDVTQVEWSPEVLHTIDVAYAMRKGNLILSSRAVSPVWWKDDIPVVCFAEQVGKNIVIPVLNFGDNENVEITVNCAEVGIAGQHLKAWLVHPFEMGADEALQVPEEVGQEMHFQLAVPRGFAGLRLIVLGDTPLL